MGDVGSSSRALKIFRWATKETFAHCLEDVTISGFYGNSLSIGDNEGIKSIDKNTLIDLEMLIPPKDLSFNNLMPVTDCLSKIL